MKNRYYRVIISNSKEGLYAVAESSGFIILNNTVRKYKALDSDNDEDLEVGQIKHDESGWVALAYCVC